MARTLAQIDTELAEVNAKISRILSGVQASTAIDGRRIEEASLETLRQMKLDLIAEGDAVERRIRRERDGSVMVGEV